MPPTYDLMLLLDPGAPDERRAKVLDDVDAAISTGGGEIVDKRDWGDRTMAYEIRKRPEAEYHLVQLSGPPALLENLHRSLSIADDVMRHRIIRVRAGTPPPPESPPPLPPKPEQRDVREPAARAPAAAVEEPVAEEDFVAPAEPGVVEEDFAAPEEPVAAESPVAAEEPVAAEASAVAEEPPPAEEDQDPASEPAES